MLINFKDQATKNLLDMIGHDTPVRWQDYCSGVIVKTSAYHMLDALGDLNACFAANEFASMEDFYSALEYEDMEFPESYDFDNSYLSPGWCWECCSDWDGPVLSITVTNDYDCEGEVIFIYYFDHGYCDSYSDCQGCDAYLKDKLEGMG